MLSDFDEVVHIPAIDDVDCGPYDGGDRKKKPKMKAANSKKLTNCRMMQAEHLDWSQSCLWLMVVE